jgi:ankyrin repeat protein
VPESAESRRAQDGWTPLHYASWSGHVDCARLLLERGADKNAKNEVRTHAPPPRRAALRA